MGKDRENEEWNDSIGQEPEQNGFSFDEEKGFEFDDEVLEKAHITKIVRDEKINNIIVEHTPEKKKTYNKESESLKNILKSLNTIDKQNEDTFLSEDNTNQDTEETFLHEEE